jgi:3-carboxy-cis,cis-muconate cycloisomerase
MSMYAAYLSDEEMAQICSEAQFIRHLLTFETALASAEARLGIILNERLSAVRIHPADLAEGTLKNGIPTIPFLASVKAQLPEEVREYLHKGATSQDAMDTAQVLMIREAIAVLETRIIQLLRNFVALIERDGNTPCMARTRWQQATPVPFGLKIVNWAMPLVRHLERLPEMKKRLLVVQLGGASGSLAALEEQGYGVMEALAGELKLHPSLPWHTQRDSISEFTHWLAMLSATLGKLGKDILLMAQTEVGEVIENAEGGGKSSAMPHKNNPVLSEALVALAHENANLSALFIQSLMPAGERDATVWMPEWKNSTQMLMNTATALKHALTISANMQLNKERMRQNINRSNGLVYAEQALTLLSGRMPTPEASQLVQQAIPLVNDKTSLADALAGLRPDLHMNWPQLLQPEACFGASEAIIRQAIDKITGIVK